jgi:DNA-binding protein HU-beta
MNKGELVDALEQRLGSKRAAADAVDAILEVIMREVASGRRVGITGFGTFERATRRTRRGRNPRKGMTVRIPASAVPRFKAGTEFRLAVAEPDGAVKNPDPAHGRNDEAPAVAAQRRKTKAKAKTKPRAKPKTKTKTKKGPRITVVSGGLPTLGKRR